MKSANNAILSKARAMYAKGLNESGYRELASKKNVQDVVHYLRSETLYGEQLNLVKDSIIHRGTLESLIDITAINKITKLIRYASIKEMKFYKTALIDYECQYILKCIECYSKNEVLNIPDSLIQYANFHIEKLLSVKNDQQLLAALSNTDYYQIIHDYLNNHETLNINELSLLFKKYYYRHYFEVIHSLYKGSKLKDLETIMYTSIELEMICRIYRLKKYFHLSKDEIMSHILTEYMRIDKYKLEEWLEADSAEAFLNCVASSKYHLYSGEKDFVYIEYSTSRIVYHLAKRYLRFSTDNALVYMTFKILNGIEVSNLKHIIEGIRYNLSTDEILALTIY